MPYTSSKRTAYMVHRCHFLVCGYLANARYGSRSACRRHNERDAHFPAFTCDYLDWLT